MDRSPPRGPRGGQGGGSRRGGGGGGGGGARDSERYGGRATDPYHSRKRSRSRSPESRSHRDYYRERGDRDRERGDREREYPKHDSGRGNGREYRGGGARRGGEGRDYDTPPLERGRDREYHLRDRVSDKGGRGGPGRDEDKPRRYRSRSRDHRRGGDRDRKDAPPGRSRSRDRHTRRYSPSPARHPISPPPITRDIEMTGDKDPGVGEEDVLDVQLQAMMGIGGFGTTKQKKVQGNDAGAVSKNTTVKYRQYMNRPGGFNRALSPS